MPVMMPDLDDEDLAGVVVPDDIMGGYKQEQVEEPPYRQIFRVSEYPYEIREDGEEYLDTYMNIKEVIGRGGYCKVKRVICESDAEEGEPGINGKVYQVLAVKMYNKYLLQREQVTKPTVVLPQSSEQEHDGPAHLLATSRYTALDLFYEYELDLWQRCAHPNIVKIFELFDHQDFDMPYGRYMYLLMQFGDYGTLGDCKQDTGKFERNVKIFDRVKLIIQKRVETEPEFRTRYSETEEVARHIFRQIAEGLRYLHCELKIAHRDIKPENIVYYTEKGEFRAEDFNREEDLTKDAVKIGDFTVAIEIVHEEMRISGRVGTEAFLPPEVFSHGHGVDPSYLPKPIDIWAVGVSLYAYLFEALPFFPDYQDYTLSIPEGI